MVAAEMAGLDWTLWGSAVDVSFPVPDPPNTLAGIEAVDTLIVSDVHLGTDLSRPDALLATLQRHTFRRLILLGDIFDDLDFRRLPRPHWDLLAYLRALCAPGRDIEVVWVAGNHDHLLSRLTRNFLGLPIHKQYQWRYEGKTFLAMHGHQFDHFLAQHPLLTEIACVLYSAIQRMESGERHRFSRFLKRTSKTCLQVSELIAQKAAAYATRRGVDGIFCGHTHNPLARVFGNVTYHNSGCWTERPATFITIGTSGIQIRECP